MYLTNQSNVAVPGRWMFRTDSAKIEAGGCNTKGEKSLLVFILFNHIKMHKTTSRSSRKTTSRSKHPGA